jgi:transcriptional regulator with XRE-family HTH domain
MVVHASSSAGTGPFALLLRRYRLDAGLTQGALAEQAGVSARTIQHLEAGMSQPQADTTHRLSAALEETAATNPAAAIRSKAEDALDRYRALFDEIALPVNADALASVLGIGISTDAPVLSQDAELFAVGKGRVAIRINPDRPETRKRFSIAHEISHTFFPNYHTKTWCRTDHRYRRRDDPDGFIEMLCDVGAAELIMPAPVFAPAAAAIDTGEGLVDLAQMFGVSREAAIRRYAETHERGVAAVFFTWK